jgi:quinol monooxygenase YgiN
MVSVGLLVRLRARPGQETAVANFLEGIMPLIREEQQTTSFVALRLGPAEFAIFDTFPDEAGRQAHIAGRAAAALFSRADELLAEPPIVSPVDVLASKPLEPVSAQPATA